MSAKAKSRISWNMFRQHAVLVTCTMKMLRAASHPCWGWQAITSPFEECKVRNARFQLLSIACFVWRAKHQKEAPSFTWIFGRLHWRSLACLWPRLGFTLELLPSHYFFDIFCTFNSTRTNLNIPKYYGSKWETRKCTTDFITIENQFEQRSLTYFWPSFESEPWQKGLSLVAVESARHFQGFDIGPVRCGSSDISLWLLLLLLLVWHELKFPPRRAIHLNDSDSWMLVHVKVFDIFWSCFTIHSGEYQLV